jgi:hypothetical protein
MPQIGALYFQPTSGRFGPEVLFHVEQSNTMENTKFCDEKQIGESQAHGGIGCCTL